MPKIAIFRKQSRDGYMNYDDYYEFNINICEHILDVPESELELLNKYLDKEKYRIHFIEDKVSYLALLKQCEEKKKIEDERALAASKRAAATKKKNEAKAKERELKKAQKTLEKYGVKVPQIDESHKDGFGDAYSKNPPNEGSF